MKNTLAFLQDLNYKKKSFKVFAAECWKDLTRKTF